MNFQSDLQSLTTRKELASLTRMSIRTLTDKFGEKLEPARSKGIERPAMYFSKTATEILIRSGVLARQR